MWTVRTSILLLLPFPSVSYTHLDVYKRQSFDMELQSGFFELLLYRCNEGGNVLVTRCLGLIQFFLEDVYKRQILWFGSNQPILDNQGNELFYPRNTWFDSDFLPFIGLRPVSYTHLVAVIFLQTD